MKNAVASKTELNKWARNDRMNKINLPLGKLLITGTDTCFTNCFIVNNINESNSTTASLYVENSGKSILLRYFPEYESREIYH